MNAIVPIRPASAAIAVLAMSAVLVSSCGGDKQSATTPVGPAVAASPSPTPAPTPTPAAPTTNDPTLPKSCQGIPEAIGTTRGCSKRSAAFLNEMNGAVNTAMSASFRDPNSGEMFNVVEGRSIKSPSAYLKTVIDYLDKQGLCAAYDGEEMNVRNSNAFNEHYDIITSDGAAWVSYNATCTPAIPIPPLPLTPGQRDPDCKLPPSTSTFCGRESGIYDGDVYDSLDELIAEDRARPQSIVFDFGDRLGGVSYGWRIKDDNLYTSETLKKLKKRGLCAIHDGDEFVVKRRTNTFSEHYDLTKSDGYSIRLFNSTCRDAGF